MRKINPAFQEHLGFAATTTCTCWLLKRTDGQLLGFTDHDRNLVVEGVTCQAMSGFQPTEAVSDLGLSVDNQEIEGAFDSEAITQSDLVAGRFDGAKVEVWFVNWKKPEERHHLRTAILGEISREDHLFKAELRGITSVLDQPYGRKFSRSCDAVLGDQKCGVDLSAPQFFTTGVVLEVIDRRLIKCSNLGAFEKDWFVNGNLIWMSGKNIDLPVEIEGSASSDSNTLKLWKAMPFLPQVGDEFHVSAGCNKNFQICKSKFSNGLNFQGFPHMPGADFVLGYAGSETLHDGSALIK